MDGFSLCLDVLSLAGQGILHILFAGRLTGKRPGRLAAYLLLLAAIQALSLRLALPGVLAIALCVLALYGALRPGSPRGAAWVAAILAVYISQLSFGIVASAEAALLPPFIGSPLLYPLLLAALALSLGICALCYAAVLRLLSLGGDAPYTGLLLLPGLFFFAAELYILHTAYRFSVSSHAPVEAGKHGALLLLQVMGLAALLCTLYAYRQLCQGFQAQAALQSLTQAARAQKAYIAEAQARYEQTRAFRHDIQNHLSVLRGLLGGGKLEESRAYLEKLEAASRALSFPCRTGNAVVDVLLGEKLGLARAAGVEAEVSLVLPRPCVLDDFDLCVLFANALDNAIRACRSAPENPYLRVGGQRQGDFFMLTFENACPAGPLPPAGTGLANIRAVAEKYHGAVLTEKAEGRFSLHVLLNISGHPERISNPKP